MLSINRVYNIMVDSGIECQLINNSYILCKCPFHINQNTPSLTVGSNVYYCFNTSCNAKGSTISFLNKLNLKVPIAADGEEWDDVISLDDTSSNISLRKKNYEVPIIDFNIPINYYCLNYLSVRGLLKRDIHNMHKKMYFSQGKGKFKNCLIYPMYDKNNNICSCITLNVESVLKGYKKYKTYIIKDNKGLGGYFKNKYSSFKYINHDYIIVTEGVLDYTAVKSLGFSSGFIGGTHLNEYQVEILNRYSHVIFFLDEDVSDFYYEKLRNIFKDKTIYFIREYYRNDPFDMYIKDKIRLKKLLERSLNECTVR